MLKALDGDSRKVWRMSIVLPMIAAVRATDAAPVDTILAEIAAVLRSWGLNARGILQEECVASAGSKPVTRLRDIADGTLIQISQDLGRNAHGCRLNPQALAEAAFRLETIVESGADLLILNRFGRSEADGAGLRSTIEGAINSRIPVLIAVRDEYAAAWDDFHAGMAVWLPADVKAVLEWCRTTLVQSRDDLPSAPAEPSRIIS
jgi:hypothetical protein